MQAETYYDGTRQKLLEDYAYNNPRTMAAIGFCLDNLPAGVKSILDVGCGIGWTSHEWVRHYADTRVHAIDLSEKLVRTAQQLFHNSRLHFHHTSVQNLSASGQKYDAVIMVDVYEHISPSDREALINFYRNALTRNGVIILTCPTARHQKFLQLNHPERLQPIDEVIGQTELEELAKGINGTIQELKTVSIWNTDDYFHAVIGRSDTYEKGHKKYFPESVWQKFRRIHHAGLASTVSWPDLIYRNVKKMFRQ